MTAATITPDAIGADLLTELHELLDACEVASSAEQVRKLCDRAAKVIGRARRRVTKYEQQTIEQAAATPKPEPKPAERAPEGVLRAQPAPQRAEVRIPPEPEPQQERTPEPPPEAPETPPLPPKGPRSWAAWANSWLLAAVSTVIAFIVGVRGICSLVARGVRWVARRIVRIAARRTVRRSR